MTHTPTSLSNYSLAVRPEQGVYDAVLQYCMRVIGQCERSETFSLLLNNYNIILELLLLFIEPLKNSDNDLIKAVSTV